MFSLRQRNLRGKLGLTIKRLEDRVYKAEVVDQQSLSLRKVAVFGHFEVVDGLSFLSVSIDSIWTTPAGNSRRSPGLKNRRPSSSLPAFQKRWMPVPDDRFSSRDRSVAAGRVAVYGNDGLKASVPVRVPATRPASPDPDRFDRPRAIDCCTSVPAAKQAECV